MSNLPYNTHSSIKGSNRIVGLESRYNRPLEFLGVYNTANDGSFRHCLPALRVAGEATEEHILTACEVYMDRSEFLTKALNDLFHCFRHEVSLSSLVCVQYNKSFWPSFPVSTLRANFMISFVLSTVSSPLWRGIWKRNPFKLQPQRLCFIWSSLRMPKTTLL